VTVAESSLAVEKQADWEKLARLAEASVEDSTAMRMVKELADWKTLTDLAEALVEDSVLMRLEKRDWEMSEY
jgi:hypothetical protein